MAVLPVRPVDMHGMGKYARVRARIRLAHTRPGRRLPDHAGNFRQNG